jgi:hypothetical protein
VDLKRPVWRKSLETRGRASRVEVGLGDDRAAGAELALEPELDQGVRRPAQAARPFAVARAKHVEEPFLDGVLRDERGNESSPASASASLVLPVAGGPVTTTRSGRSRLIILCGRAGDATIGS